ncbi:MAG: hypothetical protein HY550_02320 [Elusimicrobia bacterium]|nr:hypothetical protein [Elusimicrobiota bacterium]
MSTFFQATLDRQIKIKTCVLVFACIFPLLIVLGAAYFVIDAMRAGHSVPAWAILIFLGIVISVVLLIAAAIYFTYLLSPVGYEIQANELIIKRKLNSINIPINSIKSVSALNTEEIAGSFRVFGVDGFFGNYGTFHNSKLGKYRMYSTKDSGLVLISAEEQYILSPDQKDDFISAITAIRLSLKQ